MADATFALPPWRRTAPDLWVAGQGPRTCRLAGREADDWIFILNTGIDAWHGAAKQMAEGARAAGKDPESRDGKNVLAADALMGA